MTNNTAPSLQDIGQRLAEVLDDRLLATLFPGHTPASIRGTLRGTSQEPEVQALQQPSAEALTGRLCRLFTDGASRGNPGQAGAGAVLFDEGGRELIARSDYLGVCTNNVAEYRALLLGLDAALQLGCSQLAIALDSELIVRQIQGRYKVKNEALAPLFLQVRQRLDRFDRWTIAHVPRSQNARADQLANQGIDQRQAGAASTRSSATVKG